MESCKKYFGSKSDINMKIGNAAKKIVIERLKAIEDRYAVKIIYACESGSRAWGFPSIDSDYDIRFLYLHPTKWYLSINQGRDVIEEPIVDDFDINGWDLRKALGLLHKSNPPLIEWLGSPIVYLETTTIAERLRAILPEFYSPFNCFSHYLHMAKGTLREYLRGEIVRTKKYFYALRPVLSMQWIEQEMGVVPTNFNILVDCLVKDQRLLSDIQNLLRTKRTGIELQSGSRIESISSFIESEIDRLSKVDIIRPEIPPIKSLDVVFQESLQVCWDIASSLHT